MIMVRGEDQLSTEAQDNATLTFHMHLRVTFASRHVLDNRLYIRKKCVEPSPPENWLRSTQMTLNTPHYVLRPWPKFH